MDKIIFNDLRREAKVFNLNIDIEEDFDKCVNIEYALGPKFMEMGLNPIELWNIVTYNCERVEKLLNLDAYAKVHFKKTIQSGDSPLDDYELHPSEKHLQYMKAAEIAKSVGFDLFDKKSFDDFVVWLYQKAFAGKKLADTKPASLLNLEKFGLLVHQSSFMDRELPTDILVEKPIEKKVPEFDENNQSTTTEINKSDESDDFEVVNPKNDELA